MKLKSAPAQFAPTSAAGEFSAIVSVFGNIDSWGDVVRPGAFADTIAEWAKSGDTIPVLWSHRMDDPLYNIGAVLDIEEIAGDDARIPDWADPGVKANGGLWVRAQLDTGDDASEIARHAARLLKQRRVTQFSYAYDEIDSGPATVDGVEAWELRKLRLYEVSPTQVGANILTELLDAKTSRPDDPRLRALLAAMGTALIDGNATDGGPVKRDEEPSGVKSREELAMSDAAKARLLAELRIAEHVFARASAPPAPTFSGTE